MTTHKAPLSVEGSDNKATSRGQKIKPPVMLNIPAGEFYMGISSDQVYQLVGREEWAQEWFDKDLFWESLIMWSIYPSLKWRVSR